MKKYALVFTGKHDPYQVVSPEDGYIGDSKEKAIEQAKDFSQDIGRFGEYVREYNVAVQDEEGHTVFEVPFKSLG